MENKKIKKSELVRKFAKYKVKTIPALEKRLMALFIDDESNEYFETGCKARKWSDWAGFAYDVVNHDYNVIDPNDVHLAIEQF